MRHSEDKGIQGWEYGALRFIMGIVLLAVYIIVDFWCCNGERK